MQIGLILLPLLTHQAGKLQITDVVKGSGPAAESGDTLTMDYTGTLMNGKQFDSSIGKTPFVFTLGVGQVIKGWDQGVVGMKVGGKRILVIPSALGYGERGAGADIPPNSALKFVIELRKIQKPGHVQKTVIRAGHGAGIKAGDTVTLNYKGTFKDGKKFDSSYDPGRQPMTIQVGGGMIPGFTMGITGMKEGEKSKIVIPYMLAYGEAGRPPVIPPKSDLVFEIEIVTVKH